MQKNILSPACKYIFMYVYILILYFSKMRTLIIIERKKY